MFENPTLFWPTFSQFSKIIVDPRPNPHICKNLKKVIRILVRVGPGPDQDSAASLIWAGSISNVRERCEKGVKNDFSDSDEEKSIGT